MTLTKIYSLAQQYPTLVREVTTPTLPTFLASCLNLITPKSSAKSSAAPATLVEVIFRSFATLLPHHTTLYRPEASRLRLAIRPYLAPSVSDDFTPPSLQQSARRLAVLLHLTAAKNAGGEEWGKAVRGTVKSIHVTADQVFRAVVEDWESTAGYVGEPVDINKEPSGGSDSVDHLPTWTGIYAGVDRLVGLLAMLEEYIEGETFAPVSIPLGGILDVATRMLSIAAPSPSAPSGSARLHPAVDRDEREGLWSAMPQIYIAALKVVNATADLLQENYVPLAPGSLDLLTWIFSSGRSDPSFRQQAYRLTSKIIMLVGNSLDKSQSAKIVPVIRSCCRDLQIAESHVGFGSNSRVLNNAPSASALKGGIGLQHPTTLPLDTSLANTDTELIATASALLPLLVLYVPQRYLDIPLRSLIERTAILARNRDAMVACIMTPFIGKDGRSMTSIMPHATREFSDDIMVELLLRPRMPVVTAAAEKVPSDQTPVPTAEDDEELGFYEEAETERGYDGPQEDASISRDTSIADQELDSAASTSERQGFNNTQRLSFLPQDSNSPFSTEEASSIASPFGASNTIPLSLSVSQHMATPGRTVQPQNDQKTHTDVIMGDEPADSDDESVHLTMDLDTDTDEHESAIE